MTVNRAAADRSGLVLLARTGSTRLPAKSLRMVQGQPLIQHQIERLRSAATPIVQVLASTTLEADRALCEIGRQAGIETFQGSAENVVERLIAVADTFDLTVLGVVGGDDVFCEGRFVDAVIDGCVRQDADFVTIADVPFGTTPFGVRVTALRQVRDLIGEGTTDGWERYLESRHFRAVALKLNEPALARPELRLDVDYLEDLELVTAIYERLHQQGATFSLEAVVELLTEREPQLADLNRSAHERWLANRAVTVRQQPVPGLHE